MSDFEDCVMAIKAQPVKGVFSRMTRLMRDLAQQLGKEVRAQISGADIEVDSTVIDELAEVFRAVRARPGHDFRGFSDSAPYGPSNDQPASFMAVPILDDEDYSRREYEATVENISDCAWRIKDDYEPPDDWQYSVYDWLSDKDCGAIENSYDQGGYPSEESLRAALDALGYKQDEAVC